MVEEQTTNRGKQTLRLFREKAGKTQLQVAFEVGVQPQAVGSWENKGVVPHLDKAVKLANCLGVSLEEICEAFGIQPPTKTKETESA